MANLLPAQIAARIWRLLHPEKRVLAINMSVCRASASGASAALRPGFQALPGIFSLPRARRRPGWGSSRDEVPDDAGPEFP